MKKILRLLFVGTASVAAAFAQTTSAAAGGATAGSTGGTSTSGANAGGTTGTGIARPGSNPGQTTSPQQQPNRTAEIPRPIFITGKVIMADGSPLPPNVVIQTFCGAMAQSVGYADSRGNFSFQWGRSSTVTMDASQSRSGAGGFAVASSSLGQSTGSGCDVRADLAGFRSDRVSLFNRQALDNPDVGHIALHRLGKVEGLSVSATSLMAPKEAKKSYDKGLQLMQRNKLDEASKEFERAVTLYPKYADAWVSIGKLRVAQNDSAGAREPLLKAMELDPKLVAPHIELGLIAATEKKWQEAAPYLERGLKLDPNTYPDAWYASAVTNFNLKKYSEAEASAREGIVLDSTHSNPRLQYLLGAILTEKHEYPAAAEQFKNYLNLVPNATDAVAVRDQVARIEKFMTGQAAQATAASAPR